MMQLRRSWFRLSALCVGGISFSAWTYDTQFRYARFNRNVRSVGVALLTLYDYKVAIKKAKTSEAVSAIHDRSAYRWYNLCKDNGGLYIKIGQQVMTMSHILPPEYIKYFKSMHDRAPQASVKDVRCIMMEEFGNDWEKKFATFEPQAVASASIAQVHRATLCDGTPVAVKVQKPWIRVQMPFDFACYRLLIYGFEKLFDLPMYFICDSVIEAITKEADFTIEGRFSERACIDLQPFKDRVYIPKVFWDLTTPRVITQEWVSGVKINELQALKAAGFNCARVARTMIEVFSHQIFISGFVHGDPHPGNMFVRRRPGNRSGHQLVILDHGLYEDFREEFRLQNCRMWKAMVLMDRKELVHICRDKWGIDDVDMFATFQLAKPYGQLSKKGVVHLQTTSKHDILEHAALMVEEGYNRVKKFLANTNKLPQELVILGRHMNIMRSNNCFMGAPVNRIDIMARTAAKGITYGPKQKRRNFFDTSVWMFNFRLWMISMTYSLVQFRQRILFLLGRKDAINFEELLEQQLADKVQQKYGITFNMNKGETWEHISG